MVGAILSWGIMWPLISKNEGDWYPAGLPRNSFEGLYAYQTFTAIALFIGDGLYLLGKLLILTAMDIREAKRAERNQAVVTVHTQKSTTDDAIPSLPRQPLDTVVAADIVKEHADDELLDTGETARERALRVKVFTTGAIPWWVGLGGYCVLLVVAVVAIPYLYPPAKWYMCLCVALISPLLAFANAYGAGLTDWNMASLYGKLIILIFAAWGGVDNAGVTSGLAVCGIGFASIAAASDLMQDFKTGYLTSSSPRAMFVAQLVGAIMGCVIAPLCFLMFYSSFDLGVPGTQYAAPYATVYRGMAVLGAQGFSNLPSHCAQLMAGFFGIAFALNLARDFLPEKYGKWVPLPMGVALTFYLGAWLAISMMLGGLIVVVWKWIDKRNNTDSCSLYSSVLASGLIAGSGIWTIPSAILAVAGVNPPICMGWSDGS
jgi:OPT family oligopeptide transporter